MRASDLAGPRGKASGQFNCTPEGLSLPKDCSPGPCGVVAINLCRAAIQPGRPWNVRNPSAHVVWSSRPSGSPRGVIGGVVEQPLLAAIGRVGCRVSRCGLCSEFWWGVAVMGMDVKRPRGAPPQGGGSVVRSRGKDLNRPRAWRDPPPCRARRRAEGGRPPGRPVGRKNPSPV